MLNILLLFKSWAVNALLARIVAIAAFSFLPTAYAAFPLKVLVGQISCDYYTYYHFKGLPYLITGIGASAIMANTGWDAMVQEEWQTRLRGHASNDFFQSVDNFSEVSQYRIFIPLYLLSMWLGEEYPEGEGTAFVGTWGNHALRALLVGAPQQAALTALLGSSRPEKHHPHWAPFEYTRAVSGHAFYGALPLLNLAKAVDHPLLKASSYVASTLPAFARINNDKHYFSQAFLGWWLAFSATQIVWKDPHNSKFCWAFFPAPQTIYLGAHLNF